MANFAETHVFAGQLPILRCTLVGGIVLGVLFVICWLGATTGWLSASHTYVSLFTIAPAPSSAALASGLCWSIVFGAITGALIAFAYNILAFLDRRVDGSALDGSASGASMNVNRKPFQR